MQTLTALLALLASPFALCALALGARRRPHPAKALRLLADAMAIIQSYGNDTSYVPTEEELVIFMLVHHALARQAHIMADITLRLGERRRFAR